MATKQMALLNNYGFAVLQDLFPNKTFREIQEFLATSDSVISSLEEIKSLYKKDNEFINQVKNEIFKEQIEVFSKDGHVYNLPIGSTVLDFAYKIHTDLGNTASYGLVNNMEVPLNFKLQNEDKVEIIIDPKKEYQDDEAQSYVVTALAKKKIRERKKQQRTK